MKKKLSVFDTSLTIQQLRDAFAEHALESSQARGGTRAVKILESHFGVKKKSLIK